jgi:hypothetical protein
MHDCDGNLGRSGGNCAAHCFNGCLVGRLPGNHDEAGASRGLERLAPWAGGKKSCRSRPRICIHEQDVCVSARSTVLEGVVKDYNLGSSGDGLSDTEPSIRRNCHGDISVEALVHERFVSAITPENHSRLDSLFHQGTRDPRRNGSLSRSADRKISNAYHRDRKVFRGEIPPVVHPSSDRDGSTVCHFHRSEQCAQSVGPPAST